MKDFPLVTGHQNKSDKFLESEYDFSKMEAKAFVSVDEKIERQPLALSIGSNIYKGTTYPTPYGSYGDYSCIVGSSKSKKTFTKSLLTAAYIGGKSSIYFDDIHGINTSGKYILDFDTEQSRYHSQRVFRRVTDMVGSNTPYYVPFSLRQYSPEERLGFIDYMIYRSKYRGRIGLILIDGLVDLISDFNSLEQANMLSDKLLKWTFDGNMHIIGVLHKNFGSEKPVGHLGSTVLKKAETILFNDIDPQDKTITKVSCAYARNIPFQEFSFAIGHDGLPIEFDGL